MRATRLTCLASILVLAGCAGGGTPTPSPTASPPAATPTPSPAAFELDVLPAEEPAASRVAIPGSRYCFLVVVRDSSTTIPATIAATATRARVLDVTPVALAPGRVGEVCVAADASTVETTGSVTITAARDGVTRAVERSLPVFPMADERAADARPYFDRWVSWLATAHPELGIVADGAWQPVFVSTLLVVSHYAYWSSDWEMTVAWHNMIPPYDWTEVHLRRRGVDTAPSLAFRIDSVSGDTTPRAVDPPEAVVR